MNTVIGKAEGHLWAAPTNLATLAGQPHYGWLMGRHTSRPGDPPRTGPESVLSPARGLTLRNAHRRILPVLEYLNGSEEWLTRSWSVGAQWSAGDQYVDIRRRLNAIFGYCHGDTAARLKSFADSWGYGCEMWYVARVDLADPDGPIRRHAPAATATIGGRIDVDHCIGWHRSDDDIRTEWAGCHPAAIGELCRALQVTIWDPEHDQRDRLWRDIAHWCGAGYPGGR